MERFKIGMESFLGRNVARALVYSICVFKYNPQLAEKSKNSLDVGSDNKEKLKSKIRRASRNNPDMLTGVEVVEKSASTKKPKPVPFYP